MRSLINPFILESNDRMAGGACLQLRKDDATLRLEYGLDALGFFCSLFSGGEMRSESPKKE